MKPRGVFITGMASIKNYIDEPIDPQTKAPLFYLLK
jgi:hypothetical protein